MLPSFPSGRTRLFNTPAVLGGRGFSLRPLDDGDLTWLRELYASTRADEMAMVPWLEAAKRAFLDQQFDLQHRHYLAEYADADFLAIEGDKQPIGRYYLLRQAPLHLLVDISLFPQTRGQGVGAELIRSSQAAAAAASCGMRLSVRTDNLRAQSLYLRLGFVPDDAETPATHLSMRWLP